MTERLVLLTPLSQIAMRPTRWVWDGWIPEGELSLLAGRESEGKSSALYTLAADMTRGRLHGASFGTPRFVWIAATEESFECTIVPRLVAAGADVERVHRVDVTTGAGSPLLPISLPVDIPDLTNQAKVFKPAILILDPLTSRLDRALDTHKDSSARQGLEPLESRSRKGIDSAIGL